MLYIDDLLEQFMKVLADPQTGVSRPTVKPEYSITVGDLASQIKAFHHSRNTLITEEVGAGLIRCLYATYLSNN